MSGSQRCLEPATWGAFSDILNWREVGCCRSQGNERTDAYNVGGCKPQTKSIRRCNILHSDLWGNVLAGMQTQRRDELDSYGRRGKLPIFCELSFGLLKAQVVIAHD